MHMVFKIFNTLEKIASTNERILQAHDTMEKVAVTRAGVLTLLLRRKAYIASAMRRNPKLTKQQARNEFYKRYGLQAGEGGKISAVEGANLSKRALEMQQRWLGNLSSNKSVSYYLKKVRSKEQPGTTSPAAGKPMQQQTNTADPAPVDVPVGNGLFNNNWWKYGLAGVGGALLGRTTAPKQQPMPVMMPPQPMPAMMYNGMQY